MSARSRLALAAVAVLALTAVAVPAGAVGQVNDTINAYIPDARNAPADVALRFSRATFPDGSQPPVLLATDAAFADALASGALQQAAPLLLTDPEELPDEVAGELLRLGSPTVTVLGGEAAVDGDVVAALEELGLSVDRLAGESRLETAVDVAEQAPSPDTAILARAFAATDDQTQAFADALAAGGWAAANGWPVYLTESDVLSTPTRRAIGRSTLDQVIVLGGTAAVDEAVVDDLEDLGVTVTRVAGDNRFATAVSLARRRGFASAAAAPRVIVAEAQSAEAWAAGFTAAAHSAVFGAPIVLANGDDLPPETEEFLRRPADRAVDAGAVTGPVLVCAAAAAACDQARALLGLPAEATITLAGADMPVPSRTVLIGTVDADDPPSTIRVSGPCVDSGAVVPDQDGRFALAVQGLPGECTIVFVIAFPQGSVQQVDITIELEPAVPLQGIVTGTATGSDAYTFVPQGAQEPLTVTYDSADQYTVDGQAATMGAFENALTVADAVTFAADTAQGTRHDLRNVDAATLSSGVVGNVDLAAGTLAFVEPVTGIALRGGIAFGPSDTFRVGTGGPVGELAFRDAVNEGDTLVITQAGARTFTLQSVAVTGPVRTFSVDGGQQTARFTILGLGDDPRNAQDAFYEAAADRADRQVFSVDGVATGYDALASALSVGDQMTYQRDGGVEQFRLINRALPPVDGQATEAFNPDGSPTAAQPFDGGSLVLLTSAGRVGVDYSPDAVFQIDGRIATEAEVESELTAGDRVRYQPGDSATGVAERLSVVNGVLSGELADISEGDDTYDVVTRSGVLYDDLRYTAAVLGGTDAYVVDGLPVSLDVFEAALSEIDAGVRSATITVTAEGPGTVHRIAGDG